MSDNLSINPKLELDFSSKDSLEKSLKAKKIVGNVDIRNIINNINDKNDFALKPLLDIFIDKLEHLEKSIDQLYSREFEIKNSIADSLIESENKKREIINKFKNCKNCKETSQNKIKEITEKIIYTEQEIENNFWNSKRENKIQLEHSKFELHKQLNLIKNWMIKEYLCTNHIVNFLQLENINNDISNLNTKLKLLNS